MPYVVRPEKATRVISSADPIELESFPCWSVTRESGGMGWHIGKYVDEPTARKVARILEMFEPDEIN